MYISHIPYTLYYVLYSIVGDPHVYVVLPQLRWAYVLFVWLFELPLPTAQSLLERSSGVRLVVYRESWPKGLGMNWGEIRTN